MKHLLSDEIPDECDEDTSEAPINDKQCRPPMKQPGDDKRQPPNQPMCYDEHGRPRPPPPNGADPGPGPPPPMGQGPGGPDECRDPCRGLPLMNNVFNTDIGFEETDQYLRHISGIVGKIVDELRLAGPMATEGRLEVKVGDEWGTVCNTDFTWGAANVACRQLGFM